LHPEQDKGMKKRILIIILLQIAAFSLNAQEKERLIRSFGSGCTYLETPVYIINSDHVIYQDCMSRKILRPDMATLTLPNRARESGIAKDKNGIYYQGEFITADTTAFKILGSTGDYGRYTWIWKNSSNVYSGKTILEGADAATFKAIKQHYYADNNYVYYNGKRIEGSHGATAVTMDQGRVYDKNYVYNEDKVLTYQGENVKFINNSLLKTRKVVLNNNLKPVPGIDPATIKGLSRNFSRDKNFIYYRTEKTPIKPADFKKVKIWDAYNHSYISDGTMVYSHGSNPQPEFDAKTFGVVAKSDCYYDKNGIYKRKWIEEKGVVINDKFDFSYTIPVTEKNIFVTDNYRYLVYNNQAYDRSQHKMYKVTTQQAEMIRTGNGELTEEDGKTVIIEYSNNEATINNNTVVMRQSGRLYVYKNIDTASFAAINYNYVKDKDHVYRLDTIARPLPHIDVKTVTIVYDGFLKDANNLYYNDRPILKADGVQLLASFPGYRQGCGLDTMPATNYYFFKNSEGYWLMETDYPEPTVKFLGKAFDENWDPRFKGFELP
jgi:hypothetical protein